MAEIALHTLPGEFRKLDAKASEIILIEGGPRVLSTYPEHLSASALDQLHSLGVQVRLNTKVTSIEAGKVTVQAADGQHQSLGADQIVWAAGVKASELAAVLATQAGAKLDRSGRVLVDPDLSIPGHSNISVIGDLASLASNGVAVPGVAPAAKQMGQHVAANVLARLAGQSPRPFVYRDYGSMATIGRHRAIAVLGRWHFKGTIAWLLWLFAHIVFLIGFRNRVAVMLDWATQYWTMQRHARIIFQSHKNDPVLPTPSEVVGRAGLEPATKGL
jgi:NADH dehydrogenase